jgi:hypothetical protein
MDEERIRMRLGILQTEEEKAFITLKDKNIPPFIATVGEFNFKDEHNQITLLKNASTTDFPVQEGSFTTEIRNIETVIIFEE